MIPDRGNHSIDRLKSRLEAQTAARRAGQAPVRGVAPFEARVQVIHQNYLECKRWINGQLGTRTVHIAKHPEVRPQEWAGESWTDPESDAEWTFTHTGVQTRDVSDGSNVISQVIVPRYMTPDDSPNGSLILALPMTVAVDADDSEDDPVACEAVELGPRWFGQKD